MNDRCYTLDEVIAKLKFSRRTFFRLKAAGRIVCLEEIRPRIGRPRYRADLVDKWVANRWTEQGRAFFRHSA